MQPDTPHIAAQPAAGMPAALIADGDGRSKHFRRFKELLTALADQIGGADGLSPAQATALRNAAALQLRAEQLQGALVRGQSVDGGELARVVMVADRLIDRLRRGRAATPIAA